MRSCDALSLSIEGVQLVLVLRVEGLDRKVEFGAVLDFKGLPPKDGPLTDRVDGATVPRYASMKRLNEEIVVSRQEAAGGHGVVEACDWLRLVVHSPDLVDIHFKVHSLPLFVGRRADLRDVDLDLAVVCVGHGYPLAVRRLFDLVHHHVAVLVLDPMLPDVVLQLHAERRDHKARFLDVGGQHDDVLLTMGDRHLDNLLAHGLYLCLRDQVVEDVGILQFQLIKAPSVLSVSL